MGQIILKSDMKGHSTVIVWDTALSLSGTPHIVRGIEPSVAGTTLPEKSSRFLMAICSYIQYGTAFCEWYLHYQRIYSHFWLLKLVVLFSPEVNRR